ncbi:MAG: AI-2E family transporter [Nanobdellota archaeon]
MVKKVRLKKRAKYFILAVIILLALYITYIGYFIILPAITAAIFSYVSYPLYKWFFLKLKSKRLSALSLILILTLIIIVPLMMLIMTIASKIIQFASTFNYQNITGSVNQVCSFVNENTAFVLSQDNVRNILVKAINTIEDNITSSALWIFNSTSALVFQVLFIMIFMYYFYIYGETIYKNFEKLLPFSNESKKKLINKIGNDINALFLGQGLVALAQGLIGGVGFFIFGLENPVFWGFIMIITSILPVIGAWLVWVPAAVVIFFEGNVMGGVGLFIWGFVIVSNIDNLLRPILVNSFSRLHFLTVFLGVIIGIKAFNLIGIILGPLLISVLISLIEIYFKDTSFFGKKGKLELKG